MTSPPHDASSPRVLRPGHGGLAGHRRPTVLTFWPDSPYRGLRRVLFCFTSPRRELSARRALAATREAPALRIATAAIDPRTVSPAGPVWLPLPARAGHQVPLADLDDAIPDPWLAYQQDQARKRRQVAERDRMYRGGQDDDEDPIPAGPAPNASGEVNRRYGGPDGWASGRTAS